MTPGRGKGSMSGIDTVIWAVSAGLSVAGILMLASATSAGTAARGRRGELRITRKRAQDRVTTMTQVAMAAWMAASGILLYRVNMVATDAEAALAQAVELQRAAAQLHALQSNAANPAAVAAVVPDATSTAWVDTGPQKRPLLLREAPAGEIVAQVDAGTELVLLDTDSRQVDGRAWVAVRDGAGRSGWVAAENVRLAARPLY